jgi:hypothetical protein
MTTSGMGDMSRGSGNIYGGRLPAVGARVISSDGHELGKVREVSTDCFKVDAPMRPDYWVGSSFIASTGESEVCLSLPEDRIGEAKLEDTDGARDTR